MTFKPKLTPMEKAALYTDIANGWTVREVSVIYRVSVRSVYRYLAEAGERVPGKKRTRGKSKSKPKDLKPCGTNAAYARHKKKGEYPCSPCLEAHARNVATAKIKSNKRKRRKAA